MSRHTVTLNGRNLVVGWDHPMLTFFAQDYTTEDEETGAPCWAIGDDFEAFYDLGEFKRELARNDFTLPHALEADLYMDRDLGR